MHVNPELKLSDNGEWLSGLVPRPFGSEHSYPCLIPIVYHAIRCRPYIDMPAMVAKQEKTPRGEEPLWYCEHCKSEVPREVKIPLLLGAL